MNKTILTLEHQGHLLQVKDTKGDGRCFFRAVARSLPGYTENTETALADDLRRQACDYLRDNHNSFTDFLEDHEKQQFHNNILKMRDPKTFADDFAITALAKKLKKDIIILQPSDPASKTNSTYRVVRKAHDEANGYDDNNPCIIHYNGLDRVQGLSGAAHYSAVVHDRNLANLRPMHSSLRVVSAVAVTQKPLQYSRLTDSDKPALGEVIVLSPDIVSTLEKINNCKPYSRDDQELINSVNELWVDLRSKPKINDADLQKFSEDLTRMVVVKRHSVIVDLIRSIIRGCKRIMGLEKNQDENVKFPSVNVFH